MCSETIEVRQETLGRKQVTLSFLYFSLHLLVLMKLQLLFKLLLFLVTAETAAGFQDSNPRFCDRRQVCHTHTLH